jgi:hypothetical protein
VTAPGEIESIDLRCPVHTRRLFGRVLAEARIVSGNLIEFACTDCRNDRRRQGEDCTLVLHRFNVLGVHVNTKVSRT